MYVTRQEATVIAGNGNAFRDRARRQGDLLKSQEGFAGSMLLNSYGQPNKYTTLTSWTSREARRAWVQSAQSEAFIKGNPLSAVATPTTKPIEAYATIVDVSGSNEQPSSLILIDWALDNRPGNAAAFEASRKELFELRKKHQSGFVSNQLLRYLGSPNRYLLVQQSTSREMLPPAQTAPELQAFTETHRGEFPTSAPNVSERYEVIQQI